MTTTYIPNLNDSDAMTDIHSRMHGLISRAIPMNFRDEENLNDLLIPGQDEAYECGRRRGTTECNAEILAALRWREQFEARDGEGSNDRFERVAEIFHRDTGYLRPGKDCRVNSMEERQQAWEEWLRAGSERARAAIAKATGDTHAN